ncbi:fibronectin type III domain-containing protein [Pseudomonas putida]|uniref:fibronectin type III domain-containing protein n=1 Tax=Pseudomonas putida TaxID=303 RepID=UPI003D99C8BB
MNGHDDESGLTNVLAVSAPDQSVATSISQNSLKLIWGYGGSAGQQNSTRIKWYIGPEFIDELDVPHPARRHTITGLIPNTSYFFYLYGLLAGEESSLYSLVRAATLPASNLPESPTNLVATPTTQEMFLTWSGVSSAISYKVSHGLAPNGSVITTQVVKTTEYVISGLNSGVDYWIEVRATNNVGDSPPARVVKQTLKAPPIPTNVRATPTASTMTVEWSASAGAQDYVIRYGVEPPDGKYVEIATTSLKETISALTKNTLYFFEVSSRNANGESLPARLTQRTLDGPPIPGKPSDIYLIPSFDQLRVSWPTTFAKGYEVAYGLRDRYPDVISRHETSFLTYELKYLMPDTEYFIHVRAFNESGFSPPAERFIRMGPDRTQPRNLSAPGSTYNEVWLKWVKPENDNYVIGYDISCPGRPTVQTTDTEHIAQGLTPEQAYEFTIQPRRAEGLPPALTASISVTTHDRVPPTRPQSIKLTSLSSDTARLSWAASQDNVKVAGYEVRRNGGAWIAVTETSYLDTGLVDGETFEVRAKDAAGNASLIGHFNRKISQPTLPSAPTNFRVKPGFVPELRWDRPEFPANLKGYHVTITGPQGTELNYETTREILKPLLLPLIPYDVEIRAFNDDGSSPPLNGVIPGAGA